MIYETQPDKIDDAVLALLYLTSFTEERTNWRLPGRGRVTIGMLWIACTKRA